ncbi:MAG: LysM peptidoglycan-binding domain-containing protein [Pseudomonadota bacterium]|nr:LysM peptidoglycan-binding domain-containing protein [Pseudomonadota bacterium]
MQFWIRVYTEIDTDSGFIHDSKNLGVVYRAIRFSAGMKAGDRSRQTRSAVNVIESALQALATGKRDGLSRSEQMVLALWPKQVSNDELAEASRRVRFQLGQSNRFKEGIARSGIWKPYIYQVLVERGLPTELAVLPHVESSFNPTAYSKAGAAGLWQFTRSTGLRYMRIDHVVDERRDPFFSTVAAAQLLESNYQVIQSWPLAVTAYNHGLAGMRRAVQELGTRDIAEIVRNYKGRTFGFASRNFYVAFLAALEVDSESDKYFGSINRWPEADTVVVKVPDYVGVDSLQSVFGLALTELKAWNPALMEPVWSGDKFVPRGFSLRLPRSGSDQRDLLASLSMSQRHAAQRPDVYHRVRRGETLSGIAERYRVSVTSLMALNTLRNRNLIRIGQTLILPVSDAGTSATLTQREGAATYIVRAGDTISRISQIFKIDEQVLLEQNGVRNRNLIFPGQQLRVAPLGMRASTQNVEPGVEVVLVSGELPSTDILSSASIVSSAREQAFAEIESPGLGEIPIETNLLASTQADLAADPTDYSVAIDRTIEVQASETLGHYADWLQVRTQQLRNINRMSFGQDVVVGRKLELDFSVVDPVTFEGRRRTYHRRIQEVFFQTYQINDTLDHTVKSGESLWILALRTYRVPVWLVRQFNPDLDPDRVRPGMVIKFPQLNPISGKKGAGA